MGGGGNDTGFIDLVFEELTPKEMNSRAESFYKEMNKRRTTRHFSTREVSRSLIEAAIKTAGTAPSGAHLQPWTFVAISNQELKQKIRQAAEEEERKTYSERMPEAWSEVLRPLGTDAVKEHITDAPWVIVLFRQNKRLRDNGAVSYTHLTLPTTPYV